MRAFITWSGSTPENVSGSSGTTSGHFHCSISGGGGGPYTFVLSWVGSHTNLDFTSATSGETTVNWSGFALNEIETGYANAVATDQSTGQTYDIYANDGSGALAFVYIKRTS
jgi:hypothetical protein